MTDDPAWFRRTVDDHVAKLAVPTFVIVAAHSDRDILVEQLGPGDNEFAFSKRRHNPVWIGRRPDANDRDPTSGIDQFGERLDHPTGQS